MRELHCAASHTAISATTAAATYEALKSSDRRDEVNGLCTNDEVVAFGVKIFLTEVLEDFDPNAGDIAQGLQQLRASPPSFVRLSTSARTELLNIYRNCPQLATSQDNSSISSSGFDQTDQLAAFRVAITAAFDEAKKCSSNKTEFEKEAENIFNTNKEEYAAAFRYVVNDSEEDSWSGTDGAATAQSLSDAMESAATSAFCTWGKNKSICVFSNLFLFVFQQKELPRP